MEAKIAIDSNLHTYLLNAMDPCYDPSTDKSGLAPHLVAILRIYFYSAQPFYLVPKVVDEYLKIQNEEKKKAHELIHNIILFDVHPAPNPVLVNERKEYYLKFHNKEKDCQIIAEAEIAGIDYLLTSDDKFYKHINKVTKSIKLMKATEYWESLNIPKGSPPKTVPHSTNPLYGKNWWKW